MEHLYKLSILGAYDRALRVLMSLPDRKVDLSQRTISRHLIKLTRFGLIKGHISIRGKEIKLTEKGN